MNRHPVFFAAVAAALLALSLPALASGPAGPARIVDGDTLEVAGTTIRLHGIDAPETAQTCTDARGRDWSCGERAAEALRRLAEGGVRCTGVETDRYDRLIARCTGRAGDLGAAMVRSGMARAFLRYSDRHAATEAEARAAGRGIWAGSFTDPWEFRAARWQQAGRQAPAGCPIKGNISGNGRIYHTPWSRWYDRTRVSTRRGERWFCSEAEALAAGWRPALR